MIDYKKQTAELVTFTKQNLRKLWDMYDGTNAPFGYEGEAIHMALNQIGDGLYCAV